MQPLNLARGKLVERTQCREHISRSVRTIVFLIAATLALGIGTTGARGVLRGKTARVRADLRRVESRLNRVKQDVSGIEAVARKQKWQAQLASVTTRWMRILDSVAGSAASGVWLRRVQVAENGSSLALEGSAASYQALAAFSDRLRAQTDLVQVTLRSSKAVESKAAEGLDFAFDIGIRAAPSTETGVGGAAQAATPTVPEVK